MTRDFTSARFLGPGPTAGPAVPGPGTPPVLGEPPAASALALQVATRQGVADGLLARSTLHALIDVLATSGTGPVVLDEHAYPISAWAAAAARGGETDMQRHRHLDARHAGRLLRGSRGRPPILLADAWCAGCLEPAPLDRLLATARRAGALVVLDDSLAFGVLGARLDDRDLLGDGAGGTPAWLGVGAPDAVRVASAAKAYGAAVCVVTGPAEHITAIRERGPTRVHASGASPSDTLLLAAALGVPAGAERARLARHVATVRAAAHGAGYSVVGQPFPVIGLRSPVLAPTTLHQKLAARRIRTLVTRSECTGLPMLTLCLRADHSDADVAALVDALRAAHQRGAA